MNKVLPNLADTNFRLHRRQCRRRRGTVVTEFAICLPVLLLFLFGCYEVARAQMMQHAAESAAYEAARTGIVPNATEKACRESAAFVLRSVGVKNFSLTIQPNPIPFEAREVRVIIDIPLRSNTLIAPAFFKNAVLHGECKMQRETF
jgi:hypothetical protein